MDPPRRPLGGDNSNWSWVDPGYNKSQPSLASTPDPTRITRTYPEPSALASRRNDNDNGSNSGVGASAPTAEDSNSTTTVTTTTITTTTNRNGDEITISDSTSHQPNTSEIHRSTNQTNFGGIDDEIDGDDDAAVGRRAMETEDPCPICQFDLPREERGIIKCGHVFCFSCLLTWCKKESKCPVCRGKVCHILKTLSKRDAHRHHAQKLWKKESPRVLAKKQTKNTKLKKKAKSSNPLLFVATKTVRIRPCSQKKQILRELANAPHPQAPGGFMYTPPVPARVTTEVFLPYNAIHAVTNPVQRVNALNSDLSPGQVESVMRQASAMAQGVAEASAATTATVTAAAVSSIEGSVTPSSMNSAPSAFAGPANSETAGQTAVAPSPEETQPVAQMTMARDVGDLRGLGSHLL